MRGHGGILVSSAFGLLLSKAEHRSVRETMKRLLLLPVGLSLFGCGHNSPNGSAIPGQPSVENSSAISGKPGVMGYCSDQSYVHEGIKPGEEGTTILSVHISAEGTVEHVDIAKSSGHASLDDAAVTCALHNWHFRPAMQNGKPVPWIKNYAINWELK